MIFLVLLFVGGVFLFFLLKRILQEDSQSKRDHSNTISLRGSGIGLLTSLQNGNKGFSIVSDEEYDDRIYSQNREYSLCLDYKYKKGSNPRRIIEIWKNDRKIWSGFPPGYHFQDSNMFIANNGTALIVGCTAKYSFSWVSVILPTGAVLSKKIQGLLLSIALSPDGKFYAVFKEGMDYREAEEKQKTAFIFKLPENEEVYNFIPEISQDASIIQNEHGVYKLSFKYRNYGNLIYSLDGIPDDLDALERAKWETADYYTISSLVDLELLKFKSDKSLDIIDKCYAALLRVQREYECPNKYRAADFYKVMAQVLCEKDDISGAIENFKKALEQNPKIKGVKRRYNQLLKTFGERSIS